MFKLVSFACLLGLMVACSSPTEETQNAPAAAEEEATSSEERTTPAAAEKRVAPAPVFEPGAAKPANHEMSFSTHSDFYYCFCQNGQAMRSVEGFLSFGTWEDTSEELVVKFSKELIRNGRGTYDNLGGADAPSWAYYDEHFYALENTPQDARRMEGFMKNYMEEEGMILKPMDKDSWQSYCARPFSFLGSYPFTAYVALDGPLVKGLDKKALTEMRNEIYARHGLDFPDEETKTYFASKDWYKPQYDDVENLLSPIEKFNIGFLNDLLGKL
ncbi:MAG: YARHG domain-containing protein [Bernardetiaceae bacterium]